MESRFRLSLCFRGDFLVIEKVNNHLRVKSNIYIEDKDCFCGRPYVLLVAHKDKNLFSDANTIGIGIRDNDDFDIGLVYKTSPDEFMSVLHELINWMRDHEQGVGTYSDIWKPFDFFPDCGCERTLVER